MIKTSFNPNIQLLPYPINSSIDNVEDDDNAYPIYNVIVSQGALKMMLLVVNKPAGDSGREYETIRGASLCIYKITDQDMELDNKKKSISNDVSITNETFAYTLAPFGIKLLKINVHNHEFIECEKEGVGFIFEDEKKHEELKNRVNKVCKRMMSISKVNQF